MRPCVPADVAYDYAIIRLMPRVERGETVNVGVILSCPGRDFLEARIELDLARLQALDAAFDLEAARAHLEAIPRICRGGPEAGAIGELPTRAASIGSWRRGARSSRCRRFTPGVPTTPPPRWSGS